MRRSFKKLATGFAVAATTSLGVFYPVLEVKATPSLRDCKSDSFRVYFDTRNNVLAIDETAELVDCPVSNVISVRFHDHPHPINLTKVLDRWVSAPYPIYKGGCYAVDKVYITPIYDLTPSGRYDQRIVIKSNPDSGYPNISYCGEDNSHNTVLQPHPVAPPPPAVAASPQQVVTTLDSESKQLLRNFAQWMHWFQGQMDWFKANWPQLEPLIRAIESIKNS